MMRWALVVVVGLSTPVLWTPVLSTVDCRLSTASAAEAADAKKPDFVFKPDKGFIDDPLAVDPDSERVALLHTDSASFVQLRIVDLRTGQPTRAIPIGDPKLLVERLHFAGPGGGIVVITRDPSSGRRTAQHFGPDGKAAGAAGPATDFAVSARGGKRTLVAWDRKTAPTGETTYVVSQHQLDRLARIGKPRVHAVTKDGDLKATPFRLLAWQSGYTQMVGVRTGSYDKAKDVRQPDRAAVFDALDGRVVSESPIEDVLGWAVAANLRKTRPNRGLIVVPSEKQDAFQVIDARGRRTTVALGAPFSHYDPRSLVEQEDPADGTLVFGLSIDPLNPDALARKKADPAFLDLYVARPAAGGAGDVATSRALRAALDDRPVAWVAGPRAAVILRKFKSFSRGGSEIEIYRLSGP